MRHAPVSALFPTFAAQKSETTATALAVVPKAAEACSFLGSYMEEMDICKDIAFAMREPESPAPANYFKDPQARARFIKWSRDFLVPEVLDDETLSLYQAISQDDEVVAIVSFLQIYDRDRW